MAPRQPEQCRRRRVVSVLFAPICCAGALLPVGAYTIDNERLPVHALLLGVVVALVLLLSSRARVPSEATKPTTTHGLSAQPESSRTRPMLVLVQGSVEDPVASNDEEQVGRASV